MDISFYVSILALSWINNVGFAFITNHQAPLLPVQVQRTKTVNHHYKQTPKTKLTKLNLLFWGKESDEKKKKEKEDASKASQNARQTSKMGTTATTMENFKQSQELGRKTGFFG